MDREFKTEIKIAIWSFVGVIVFEFVSYYAKQEVPEPSIIKDIILLGMLLSIFLITVYRLPYLPRIFEDVSNSAKQLDQITNIQLKEALKKIEDLGSDHKVNEVNNRLASLNGMAKVFGSKVYYNYLRNFRLVDNGFAVEGEQFALSSYAEFWRQLNEEQNIRNALKKPCLIARITHSNEIQIWDPNMEPKAYKQAKLSLYNSQKEFVKNGGIIVRVLIGREKAPNANYKSIIEKMSEIGIEVKYFDETVYNVPDYDFLYLADEGIVLKWYAALGQNLTGFEVTDAVEDEVKEVWETIYNLLRDGGDPITSIPPERGI